MCRGLNVFFCFVILLIYYYFFDFFMFEIVLINIYFKYSVFLVDLKLWLLCEFIYINWLFVVCKLSWELYVNIYYKEEFLLK